MDYHSWNKKTISDFSSAYLSEQYNQGYVFTRIDKGVMNQTRSLRIDLLKFIQSSENKRVLRKAEDVILSVIELPIPLESYSWKVHKLGKDFYQKKFADKIFSAAKIRELLTNKEKSNFNTLLSYTTQTEQIGYAICYESEDILHYAFPFYRFEDFPTNYGMAMMLYAILYARAEGKKYVYLGSVTRPTDKYKLQFSGLEWFDGKTWQNDTEELKSLI